MNKTYYNDEAAKRFYEDIKQALAEFNSRQLPKHMLTHAGVSNNYDTDEIRITLHFNLTDKYVPNPTVDSLLIGE